MNGELKDYDFLVIGSGIAGLVYALQAARLGSVAVVTKSGLYDCNTDYAQGGIAAVLDVRDSFEEHCRDTYAAGAELGKMQVIEHIISEGPKLIQYLIDLGTDLCRGFDRPQDHGIPDRQLPCQPEYFHI